MDRNRSNAKEVGVRCKVCGQVCKLVTVPYYLGYVKGLKCGCGISHAEE